jgi:hypothetical protein
MATNPYESPENRSNLTSPPWEWIGSTIRLTMLFGLLGMLLLMFVPRWPIGGARESARRTSCTNNLHNIAIALHNYESTYHCLPPAYTVDADGRPLHSWRTLILPFIEQKALYDQIDLTKAWDDPVHEQVRNTVLKVYECPSNTVERGKTTYMAVVVPGGCFQATEARRLADVKDRRDLTLMVVEVPLKHATHWMSPSDASEEMIFVHDKKRGEFSHSSGPQAAFVDGSVGHLENATPAAAVRAMISVAGSDDETARDHR